MFPRPGPPLGFKKPKKGRNKGLPGMIGIYSHEKAELSRHRNALLPISQLPESVLVEIFDFYREMHLVPGDWNWLAILRITHVCHSWRAIASSHGKLWKDIEVTSVEQVQHWLARAPNCPLDVRTIICTRDDRGDLRSNESNALCLALEELPRIRTLHISKIWCTDEQMSASHWINSPATLLESLDIHVSNVTYSKHISDPSFCITTLFLRRDLPSLTHLEISDSRFSSNDTRFPQSLKHLHLISMDVTANWEPHIASVLLAILDSLPSLEVLLLGWQGGDGRPIIIPAVERQVTLPHLRKMSLMAYSQHEVCACLLEHLTYPSGVKTMIHADHDGEAHLKSFMQNVTAKLSGRGLIGDVRPLRNFYMSCCDFQLDHFWFGGSALTLPLEAPDDTELDIDLDFPLLDGSDNSDFGEIIGMICDTLPLSQVEILTLRDVCLKLQDRTFVVISQTMPVLHTLCIRGWIFEYSTSDYSGVAFGDIRGLFPHLRHIHLRDLGSREEKMQFWDFLADFLAFRQASGAPIEKVTMVRCDGADLLYRTRLQGLVGELIWEVSGNSDDD